MLEIIFTACLIALPGRCAEHSLSYSEMNELQCMSASQSELAKWQDVHPGWRVTRWGCRRAGMTAKA